MLNIESLISNRANSLDASGIRKIFEMSATLTEPINLSIGQPDFDVPDSIKEVAIDAIRAGKNQYTQTQGIAELHDAVSKRLQPEIGWDCGPNQKELGILVTSGTSGALFLCFLAMANPGDEVIMPDPFFVIYPAAAKMMGATPVYCDTYPDFRMTAERIEPLITERTKFVIINSPSNPSGVVLNDDELKDIVELCESRGVMVVSDEIYDEFCYPDGRDANGVFPTPARYSQNLLLLRGFSKTYGMTGWRLGYVVGPKRMIEEFAKMQQYTFVCAPSMVQVAGVNALNVDMSSHVAEYARKRDMVVDVLKEITHVPHPAGAFYAFPEVPKELGMTATEFVTKVIERNVLIIPGGVFSNRDTHFRLSYATKDEDVRKGVQIIADVLRGK